ncbi:MAG: hypothetical protein A3F54_00760 [Candidatus Kerfeldbacteria bacterium RIFCSPHIGHO2_12_FULL_48_17]|uniref:Transcription regulator TrmB N-terminal domain-containing protein n=1 Tax=Candidatus Kerfeldbacteria bacterium RIFCSPHIGHO2_12_FULL_48_17 TaxID=1798542 RepID=A0A1G2B5T9_9BACT|nr:MAG: hypothetical protein A3F54_00760 [Candidatus Kerfeldbacteria bacterium RIFCSPHIGHO2_12_FULL_48_17]
MSTLSSLQQSLYTSLTELGLSHAEAELYLLSLHLGPQPLTTLARDLQIARPNIYKLIRALETHALAKFSQRKKYSQKFMVESPAVVLEQLRAKRKQLDATDNALAATLPDLLAQYHQGATPTKVKVLTDEEQYLRLYYRTLEEAQGATEWFGAAHEFIGFVSWEREREWIRRRIEKGISIKALLLPSETAAGFIKDDAREMRETRVLREAAPFLSAFQLFANKVVFWQPRTPLAVVLEDEYIAGMMRSIFYQLWEGAGRKI